MENLGRGYWREGAEGRRDCAARDLRLAAVLGPDLAGLVFAEVGRGAAGSFAGGGGRRDACASVRWESVI